jgi:type I restriction enzyme, S subunit
MSFARYERYKDSGVEWLGEVPEHWSVAPVRSVVQHLDKRNEGAECQEYLSLMANIGVMPYAEKGDIGNKKPEDLSKCKIVRVGNIVINSMNYNIGSYGMSSYDGVCSPVYVVLEIKEEAVLPRFGFRIFQNTAFQRCAIVRKRDFGS